MLRKFLFLFLIFSFSSLFANAGIPLMPIHFYLMILSFPFVIIIEAIYYRIKYNVNFTRLLWVTFIANSISTLLGIGLVFFLFILLNATVISNFSEVLSHFPENIGVAFLVGILTSSWASLVFSKAYLNTTMIIVAITFNVILAFILSVFFEHLFIKKTLLKSIVNKNQEEKKAKKDVFKTCFKAHIISYLFMIISSAILIYSDNLTLVPSTLLTKVFSLFSFVMQFLTGAGV